MKTLWQLILCLLILCNGSISAAEISGTKISGAEEKNYIFSVVPQQTPKRLLELWKPIIHYLHNETGYHFTLKIAPKIPVFESRLEKGEYDFAYMNPLHYILFHQKAGYKALAHAKDKKLKGIIVVNKNSTFKSLNELVNRKIAFPAPTAFAATLLPQAHLKKAKLNFTPRYLSSHDSVYRAVANELYPAGGGVIRTFNSIEASIRDQLRILWTSEGYTPHAIAAHPRVAKHVMKKVQAALIKMHTFEKGKALLSKLRIKGFQKAEDSNWNDVRALDILTSS